MGFSGGFFVGALIFWGGKIEFLLPCVFLTSTMHHAGTQIGGTTRVPEPPGASCCKKKLITGCLGDLLGMKTYPVYIGIVMNYYKDPYETTRMTHGK